MTQRGGGVMFRGMMNDSNDEQPLDRWRQGGEGEKEGKEGGERDKEGKEIRRGRREAGRDKR